MTKAVEVEVPPESLLKTIEAAVEYVAWEQSNSADQSEDLARAAQWLQDLRRRFGFAADDAFSGKIRRLAE